MKKTEGQKKNRTDHVTLPRVERCVETATVTPSSVFFLFLFSSSQECVDVNGDSAFFFFSFSTTASEKIKTDGENDHLSHEAQQTPQKWWQIPFTDCEWLAKGFWVIWVTESACRNSCANTGSTHSYNEWVIWLFAAEPRGREGKTEPLWNRKPEQKFWRVALRLYLPDTRMVIPLKASGVCRKSRELKIPCKRFCRAAKNTTAVLFFTRDALKPRPVWSRANHSGRKPLTGKHSASTLVSE